MKHFVPLVALTASLLVVTACGAPDVGEDMTREPGPGSGAGRGGSTDLTIVVRGGPGQGKRTFSLACDPAGGNHPDPQAACRWLDETKDPFAPVPPTVPCTEVYGGPQTAAVTGTLRGEPVDARFNRTDGCEVARWDQHLALLVETGGVKGT